jgi:tripartite-type tricarboxylate transporter receptor subunit TctC
MAGAIPPPAPIVSDMTFANTGPWQGPTPIIAQAAEEPVGSHDEHRLRRHYPIGPAGMSLLVRIFPCLIVLAAALTSPLSAQQWPTRPLRIVTGTPAGGSPDFVSRLLADKLSERLGQTVVVENSATTGVAAWNTVAKAQPDGYVISMLTGAFSARAAVAKALPYDPIKDFTFITLVSGYPMVVATAPSSSIKSFPDLIARAKAAPFDVTYGMNLPGSVHHLTGELINIEAGTSLRGIPYRGNTQIVQDLLGGRLDVMIETGTVAFAQIRSGTLRGLAVSSRKRFVLEPEIPAIDETLPGFEVMSWLGLAAPGGTPRPIVERLNREVGEVLTLPEIRDKLASVGNVPMPSTPEEMQAYIERDALRWSRVVDIKGIEKY